MRVISEALEATIALVFILGLLGSLLGGSRAASRQVPSHAPRLDGAQAWVSGFGGSMGWDGGLAAPPPSARSPERSARSGASL